MPSHICLERHSQYCCMYVSKFPLSQTLTTAPFVPGVPGGPVAPWSPPGPMLPGGPSAPGGPCTQKHSHCERSLMAHKSSVSRSKQTIASST